MSELLGVVQQSVTRELEAEAGQGGLVESLVQTYEPLQEVGESLGHNSGPLGPGGVILCPGRRSVE